MTDNFDFFERQFTCPVCSSDKLVIAHGPTKSSVLIIASEPGEEELKQGLPMVGNMGNVLRTELAYLKFDFKSARRTNLWRHTPNKNKECLQNGMEEVIKEAKGRKGILLLGNEVADLFVGKSVMKVAGLNVKSDYFSAPVIVCCPNPAMAFHSGHGIGEIRLALTKFIRLLESVKDVVDTSSSSSNNSSDPWL
jgi:uracil-DNA glycosylase family 4